jgi:anti-sigma factor RsiW
VSACADKELLLHALADGELDAGNAAQLEAHVAGCPACAVALAEIREVKARLSATPAAYAAPPSLHARLDAALAEAAAPPPRRGLRAEAWVMSGAIGALAASLALVALLPSGMSVEGQLIDAQARSLEAQHLVDVATSDRHTVKPWFNGKLDFAPPVADLAPQGYPLVGGRLDRIDGRRAAALVFHRHAHTVNLFIWPGAAPETPVLEHREGYSLVRWGRGGLVFWAVSDIDPPDLLGFQKAFVAATGS